MKNIKKLLFPVATIAATAGLVTPLLTSCGAQTTGISEISQGYIPSIQKHGEQVLADPDSIATEYLEAIKANPSILDEDNKYSSGQVYDLLVKLFEALKDTNDEEPTADIKINSFKAGASDLEVTEEGKYTYKNGISTSLTASVNVWVNYILAMLFDNEDWLKPQEHGLKDYGYHDIVITTNNLGYETKFTNFEKFNVTHSTTLLGDGYTLVQPVFPADLTDKTWAVDFAAHGDLNVKVNDVEIISLSNIDLTYTFNYNNIALLEMDITSMVEKILGEQILIASDIYLIDALQELGSFASYYLSDVSCIDRLIEEQTLVDFYEDNGQYPWLGKVVYYGGSLDATLCHVTHFAAATPAYCAKDITKTTPAGRYYSNIGLKDSNIYNEVNFAIVKEAEDNEYVHEWKERHSITPRFNVTVDYGTETKAWASSDYSIYKSGTQCVFHLDPSETEPITTGQYFRIYDEDATSTDLRYINLQDVTVYSNGTKLVEGTDYEMVHNNTAIKFLKDHKETDAETISIVLTCGSSVESETTESGTITYHTATAIIE